MEWACRLDKMVPSAPIEGMALLSEQLTHEEMKKRIKARLGSVPNDIILDLCPPMHLDHGFVEMVSAFLLLIPLDFFFYCLTRGLGGCRRISAWSSNLTHPFLRM
jgi:23S rRNA U2552 (ribose-2'-O)-methylase RlmE/FtsJ